MSGQLFLYYIDKALAHSGGAKVNYMMRVPVDLQKREKHRNVGVFTELFIFIRMSIV